MKRLKDKLYHERITYKRFRSKQKRKNKHYKSEIDFTENDNKFLNDHQSPNIKKRRLNPPKKFSFIFNRNPSLKFFNDIFRLMDNGYKSIMIDMIDVEELSIEVLLYIISLDKINKENNREISLKIRVPRKQDLKHLIAQSGLSKYFRSNVNVKLDEKDIFPIQDGETNIDKLIDDAITCRDAADFARSFFPKEEHKNLKFRALYNALAEMMTNTDNHAYDQDEDFRNWYLFAVKVDAGIAFYFFDNGKGIIRTAKKNILEKALSKTFSLGHESIMRAVLNGEYRSATNLTYRNKGLPEINDFLIENYVSSPIILSDKIMCCPSEDIYFKNEYNFKGTLFVWILKVKEE